MTKEQAEKLGHICGKLYAMLIEILLFVSFVAIGYLIVKLVV